MYGAARALIRFVLWPYFRVKAAGRQNIPRSGPVILAPVHRSNLDSPLLAPLTRRRFRALAKESLFSMRPMAWFLVALGAFPVRRGSADRESIRAARSLLDTGAMLLVFPEGGRQTGDHIADLFDGTAYLAAKTGAVVVPVGISGTEAAMPMGARIPRPRRVCVAVGQPIPPPDRKAPRSVLREWTTTLTAGLQEAQDTAISLG
ncbi:MAG: 1-acyl-sn-glycerol-3-phosphate acyltransferase [Actinobacteria bacterium]|nr:1-acyl-sn-glycerol-3-phosphate acyltransferase [Actinomycetota bacterium]MBT4037557.1 1-acyl-sn-glycerol-3-phosphate acyltransferase [Actinomycetota bacterium]MBT4279857.1 1-acyl-sn-glycerol-3-phosphate acyltransferase [Actinomycetota bacterium]MBT4786888.1 1-acyl-sn-glycerol-3-phosphate acyltransferase [Actinomycetota bacterium]MBT5041548.1 1-acyl-sn-glycerol-3-phosphate acyltransferase [Actinomycetota bacterium]